jgi:predicted component of type VI protein secretion system
MAANAGPRTNAILKLKAAGRTRLIVFDTQDLSLGRAKENDLSVDDPEMSRKHAVFKRSREGCAVEDMGTSNGTAVNGQTVQRAVLKHGDVVKIGEVEITYAETTRAPSSLGPVEYASQLKAFGTPMARVKGDGEATILGVLDAPTSDDEDDFEVRPAGEFDFNLQSKGKAAPAPRDLDAEIASLDIDSDFTFGSAPTQAPARPLKPAPRPAAAPAPAPARKPAAPAPAAGHVWELDEAPAQPKPTAGPIALTLEIDGLSGELRRAVEALLGKVIELPSLHVKIKGRDLA